MIEVGQAGVSNSAVLGRIEKLEDRYGIAPRKPPILLVVCRAGWGLALDSGTCIKILGECGYLPTESIGLVSFLDIPDGLNAEETEKYLRESGRDVCRLRIRKEHEGPAGTGVHVDP